ncbi:hypothetical protein [Microcoleus sp.]|uniref:hypothetical protein n=1 Tax=Microcoleus sp. TaxID=44472 RepID=UPI0035934909
MVSGKDIIDGWAANKLCKIVVPDRGAPTKNILFISRRKKEEGRRKKEEGRGKKEEGRRKKEEGRRKREEGRRKKEEETFCKSL